MPSERLIDNDDDDDDDDNSLLWFPINMFFNSTYPTC